MFKVLVLAAGVLGSALCQTCPSYTAGYTGTQAIHDSSSGKLYVNESPSLRAPCDGTVYRWHYCYYDTQNEEDIEVAFGAYRAETDGYYYLRTGSYYLLHLDSRETSFTCDTVDLDEQDYFQIYDGDRVGACMKNGVFEFLDVLAESAPNDLRVGAWGSSSGQCRESDMSQSSSNLETQQGMVLHLYVSINIDECAVGEDNCHSTRATCADVVGGQDSFTCTCIAGYTGDGVTCSNIDECQLGLDGCVNNSDCSDTEGSYECTCSSGFSGDGLVNCENIDECTESTDMCDSLAVCSDTEGSYNCSCSSGYTGSGFACNDIDECGDGTDSCDENADCTNTNGSYTCSCSSGFSGNGTSCIDINGCEDSSTVCGTNTSCTNTAGSYECTCNDGYSGDGLTCYDVDECVNGNNNCDENTDCINTEGSYICMCSSGFSGNGTSCNDINECDNSTVMCGLNASCTNTAGSFECTCDDGYSGDGLTCNDINECEDGTDSCDGNADCTNTDGGYTCSCSSGFSGDGLSCDDIDECGADTHNCAVEAVCTNTEGSYNCTCSAGYTGNGTSCNNFNECQDTTVMCGLNATCTNTAGSYECVCDDGYSGDGLTCNDVDECVNGNNNCDENANCTNTEGSYICMCSSGFSRNGTSCNDINECEDFSVTCTSNASCVNTAGSYECVCKGGYSGNGSLCIDINECEDGTDSCDENADCTNIDGSYTCACSSGFSGDGLSCDDIDECASEVPCDPNATCTNMAGSYTCQCAMGFSGDGTTCEELEAVEEEQRSRDSANVILAAILAVLGALLAISVIIIATVCIVRRTKPAAIYRKKQNMSSGFSNSNTASGSVQLYSINTGVYDYPTLASTDTKPPLRSPPPLEFYSSAEYSEVITLSSENFSVSYKKANGGVEAPYYTPASQEEEIYSQLRQEKIKAIPKDEIEIAERLGGGEFGDVVRGDWRSSDYSVEVALKTLSGEEGPEGRRKLLQEAAIMSQFRHPNVVKLYGVVSDDQQLMLVLELLGKGDLRQLLHTMRPDPGELISPQTPMLLLSYSQQIAEGLQYLSRKNFVHRDLAARNILISSNNTCKISDFGMARNLIEDDYYVSQGGKIPLKWTAPEALIFRKYTTASDVWSYGCVLYEIWSLGHKPFESMTNQEVLVQVESGYRLPPPPGCPQVIYGIMIRCWHPKASSRPSAVDIVLALMENEKAVLKVPEKDAATRRLAGALGAPLDEGQDMYSDLQETFYSELQAQMSSAL